MIKFLLLFLFFLSQFNLLFRVDYGGCLDYDIDFIIPRKSKSGAWNNNASCKFVMEVPTPENERKTGVSRYLPEIHSSANYDTRLTINVQSWREHTYTQRDLPYYPANMEKG